MIFKKFETNYYCVGGRHRHATSNIVGDKTINKKTGKEFKLLIGICSICNRKKSMIVFDDIIVAALGDFFKSLAEKGPTASKMVAKNVLKNPGRSLEIGAIVGSAFASRSPKAALSSLPEVINFYHTDKRLHLGKFV